MEAGRMEMDIPGSGATSFGAVLRGASRAASSGSSSEGAMYGTTILCSMAWVYTRQKGFDPDRRIDFKVRVARRTRFHEPEAST
jgi:hypothetical protein